MGLLDRWLKPKKSVPKEEPKDNVTPIKRPPQKTAKELATERGEPYVNIVSMEIDSNNLHQGAFELDWNDKFVSNLIRAGYQMKPDDTDADIVDRWFQNVCRHVVMETWEQEEAMRKSGIYVKTTDLGGGRKEVS